METHTQSRQQQAEQFGARHAKQYQNTLFFIYIYLKKHVERKKKKHTEISTDTNKMKEKLYIIGTVRKKKQEHGISKITNKSLKYLAF